MLAFQFFHSHVIYLVSIDFLLYSILEFTSIWLLVDTVFCLSLVPHQQVLRVSVSVFSSQITLLIWLSQPSFALYILVRGACQQELELWPLITAPWWPCCSCNIQALWCLPVPEWLTASSFSLHKSLGLPYSGWITGALFKFIIHFGIRKKMTETELGSWGTGSILNYHHQAAAQI